MFKKVTPLFIMLTLLLSFAASQRVDATAHPSVDIQYLTMQKNGSVGGISFKNEDIIGYNRTTQAWEMVFDGSDVGVQGNVNAIAFDNNGDLYLSVQKEFTLAGVGLVDDSDVLKFEPTGLGPNTAGTFSLHIDGSLIGLDTNGEDIDGLIVAPNGRLAISTIGTARVNDQQNNQFVARDEDVLTLWTSGTGANTAGYFELLIDNSKHQLATDKFEDVWALDAPFGILTMSTMGSYDATDFYSQNIIGDSNHTFACSPFAGVPSDWDCIFRQEWDGTAAGLPANNSINGMASKAHY